MSAADLLPPSPDLERRRAERDSIVAQLRDAAEAAARLNPSRVRADTMSLVREGIHITVSALDDATRQTALSIPIVGR